MYNSLKFIENQKGKPTLVHDGHRYNFSYHNKSGTSMWRCINRSECSASVTLNTEKTTIIRESKHACRPHYNQNQIDIFVDTCKKAISKNMTPVKKVFEKHLSVFQGSAQSIMPSFEEKKSSLYRKRHNILNQNKTEFNRLADVKIPQMISDNFLVIEDGMEEKILVFSTKQARKLLLDNKYKMKYGDGTFKRTPKPFYQLFTVHVDISRNKDTTNVVPIVYVLLPNKSQETYTRMFNLLKDRLGLKIELFKCDFEIAIINGVKEVFPSALISGCYYHYNRAVWKQAKKLKITATMENRELVRMCANLPLLPKEKIQSAWVSLEALFPQSPKMIKFQKYFSKQWMSLCAPFVGCEDDKHRTNNAVEGWHRRLNTRMPHKPTLVRFLYNLKKEAKFQDTKIKNSLFSGVTRRRRDILFDKNYKKQLNELQSGEITEIQFLENITTLKKRLH